MNATADQGRCGTCGWLAMRVIPTESTGQRAHSGFFETEQPNRDKPHQFFKLVPGDANAWHDAHLVCFRSAADLPKEMNDAARTLGTEAAAHAIIWRDRHCPRWCRHEPGLSPRDHLYELKARDLEEHRRHFQRSLSMFEVRQAARESRAATRLNKAAILFASIIGVVQIVMSLVTMPPDAWLRQKLAALSADKKQASEGEKQHPTPEHEKKPPAAGLGG